MIRDEVVEMLREFALDENHSILISSHIVSDLEKLCDYVAFLHKGKLLLCEEKDQLLARYGIIHCTAEQLAELDPAAIRHKKESLICRKVFPHRFVRKIKLYGKYLLLLLWCLCY